MDTAAAERGRSGDENQQRVAPYTRRTTDDRDEAEKVITELYLPNRLDLSKSSEPLDMQVTGLQLGALTAGRLTYGRPVRLRTADAEGLHVNLPLRGTAASRSGTGEPVTTGPGEGLVFSPGAPAEMSWSADCEQLCLMIPQARLESELEQLLGRPLGGRLVFDFAADLSSPMASRLRTVLDLLIDELEHPTDLSRNAHAGQHVEGLVLDGLLLGLRHSHSGVITGSQPRAMRTAIRRAVELIEEQPAQPWTTVRLAARGSPQRSCAPGRVPPGPGHATDGLPASSPAAPGTRGAAGCCTRHHHGACRCRRSGDHAHESLRRRLSRGLRRDPFRDAQQVTSLAAQRTCLSRARGSSVVCACSVSPAFMLVP